MHCSLAALGVHIENNGEPGWQGLGRGYRDLLIWNFDGRPGEPRPDVINDEARQERREAARLDVKPPALTAAKLSEQGMRHASGPADQRSPTSD